MKLVLLIMVLTVPQVICLVLQGSCFLFIIRYFLSFFSNALLKPKFIHYGFHHLIIHHQIKTLKFCFFGIYLLAYWAFSSILLQLVIIRAFLINSLFSLGLFLTRLHLESQSLADSSYSMIFSSFQ